MKKLILFISAIAFSAGMTFAQHGGGHPHGGGAAGDSTVCDSTMIGGGHVHPGDSAVCDSTGIGGHPGFPHDSIPGDSLNYGGHGHPWGGHHGAPADSALCDSTGIGGHGFPWGGHHGTPGDSALCDSTGIGGHPWGGSHGHHGDSLLCDSTHIGPNGGGGVCDTIVTDTTGINTKATLALTDVLAYPNPVVNELNVSFNTESNEIVILTVYNMYGQKVEAVAYEVYTGKNVISIDISNLPKGNYILNFQQGNQNSSYQILK